MAARKRLKSKVCLVGEVAVGKTSLIRRYVQNMFDDRYIMTIGTKVTKKSVDLAAVGTELDVEIRGQAHPARVVKTPFYPSKAKKS